MTDLDVHLDAIVAGDPDAFARWLAGAEAPLRSSLASFAARVDTEVVVQEALLRAWRFAPRVERDGRGNSLLRYALRIGRNLAIDHLRALHDADPVPEDLAAEEAPVPDPALARWIRICLEALPERPRAAIEARLRAQGGVHDRELAEGLAMQLNTFLKNVGRARALLVDCLAGHGVDLRGRLG